MEEDGEFIALAVAALAAREDAERDGKLQEHTQETVVHPLLSRMGDGKMEYRYDRGEALRPDVQLKLQLDVFERGSIAWGLVDDWRPDGSVYKRHGVIFTLGVKLFKAIEEPEHYEDKLRTIREAIDLVQLVIALDPWAIPKISRFDLEADHGRPAVEYEEELRAVARGVPWELRLHFIFDDGPEVPRITRLFGDGMDNYINKVDQLQPLFSRYFMEGFDSRLSDSAIFKQQRQELLHALVHHKFPTLKRVVRLATHSYIHAVFEIDSQGGLRESMLVSENFFAHLTAFATDLDRYQSRVDARRWRKHAPFRVEQIVVKLGQLHITRHIAPLATELMKSRIPVEFVSLCLDMMLVRCGDEDFCEFLQVVAAGAKNLIVKTADHGSIDRDDQDRSQRIRSLLKGIGTIKNMRTLNIGGLLRMCTTDINRGAVWRGLFEDVLCHREEPLESLMCRRPDHMSATRFTDVDALCIQDALVHWRETTPEKKRLVRYLDLSFTTSDIDAVRTLVCAFDEVEKLNLDHSLSGRDRELQRLSEEDLVAMLHWPGLQSVRLANLTVATMDVFNTAIPDTRIPKKPVLRDLELTRIVLEDTASLPRFLEQLKQIPGERRLLADKLEVFKVSTDRDRPILESSSFDILHDMLKSNRTLRNVAIVVPPVEPKYERLMSNFMRYHSGCILAPTPAQRQSAIAVARKTAFLSAISDGVDTSARYQLDSTLVSNVLALSVPHSTRSASAADCYR